MKQNNLLKSSEVMARLRCGATTLWRIRRRDPNFPKPLSLGGKTLLWRESELDAWIDSQAKLT